MQCELLFTFWVTFVVASLLYFVIVIVFYLWKETNRAKNEAVTEMAEAIAVLIALRFFLVRNFGLFIDVGQCTDESGNVIPLRYDTSVRPATEEEIELYGQNQEAGEDSTTTTH